MGDAKRDNNYIPTLLAVSNVDGITPVVLYADPTTHRLLVSISGGVTGPASSTDNAIVRWDGTGGGTLQDSGVIVDDTNNLLLVTSDGGALGSATKMWSDLFLASGGVINFNNGNYLLTHSAGLLTTNGALTVGGTLALAANSLTMTGSIGATGARVTKLWATDIESTNYPTVGGTAINTVFAPIASPTFTGTVTLPVGLTGVLRADVGVVSIDTDVTDLVSAATDSAAGKVELATDAEAVTGSDTARAVTPANLTARMAAPGTIGGTTPGLITGTTITANTAFAPDADDGAALGTSSLGFADLFLASGGNVLVANANAKRTIILSAAGGAPTTTIGCGGPTKVEAGTNDIDYYVLEFDTTTEERAFWNLQMPDNYDGSTITARFIWTNAAGLSTETVRWGIKARAYADDAAIDQAYGTEITVDDTWLAQGDVHISAASSAITIGGSPAGGQYVVVNVGRKTASDNLTGDARLLAVQLEYGINAYSD